MGWRRVRLTPRAGESAMDPKSHLPSFLSNRGSGANPSCDLPAPPRRWGCERGQSHCREGASREAPWGQISQPSGALCPSFFLLLGPGTSLRCLGPEGGGWSSRQKIRPAWPPWPLSVMLTSDSTAWMLLETRKQPVSKVRPASHLSGSPADPGDLWGLQDVPGGTFSRQDHLGFGENKQPWGQRVGLGRGGPGRGPRTG